MKLNKQYSFLAVLLTVCGTVKAQNQLTLHYNKPAKEWTEALPVGNGRLGAMVFGKTDEELIQLNEASLWSGGPVAKNVNPTAFDYLAPTRKALAEGDYEKAYELTKKMQGVYSESYMPLGDLILKQDLGGKTPTAYYRGLNIQDAVATTTFTIDGVTYKREVFASAPGESIIIRLTASKAKSISFTASTASKLNNTVTTDKDMLVVKGKAPAHADPSYISYNKQPVVYEDVSGCRGMRFETVVKPVVKDGTVTVRNGQIQVKNATEVVLIITAATKL